MSGLFLLCGIATGVLVRAALGPVPPEAAILLAVAVLIFVPLHMAYDRMVVRQMQTAIDHIREVLK